MEQLKQIQKYYEDSYLFQHPSPILNISVHEKLIRLLLQENIFHPQGGGQPDDEGYVTVNEEQFKVFSLYNDKNAQSVFLNFEHQQHLLDLLTQAKESNNLIIQQVNEQKRKLCAQLHSGGHFLDMAVKKVGLKWIPSKGYHFPDGAYVEYIGTIEGKAEEIQAQLQQQCDVLLKETDQNDGKKVEYLNEQQLQEKLGEMPPYLKGAQNVRFVQLSTFDNGCPCGGTHVNHIREIGQIVIGKIQKKGKNVRVSYKI